MITTSQSPDIRTKGQQDDSRKKITYTGDNGWRREVVLLAADVKIAIAAGLETMKKGNPEGETGR